MTLLAHGPWTAELRGDELAEIAYRGEPVLRGIRAVVRNHNWLTLAPTVRGEKVDAAVDGGVLAVELDIAWAGYGAAYAGTLALRLEAGALEVAFRGEAPEEILSNRIGLVVLHRPDDAGRDVLVGATDGSTSPGRFPEEISPHQPFKDLASLAWERAGTRFRLAFSGDVFETEDQRNWTDASFKTYSTPLERPFPVRHAPGSRVEQSVRLEVRHVVKILDETVAAVPELGTSAGSVPGGGLDGLPADGVPMALGPLLVEASAEPRLGDATVGPAEAAALAAAAPSGIDLRIVAENPEDAAAVLARVLTEAPTGSVRRLGAFDREGHTASAALLAAVAGEAHAAGQAPTLVGGARSHFTELNRSDGVPPAADALAYSVTSQMHAVEARAVVETLAIQPLTVRAARRLGGGRPRPLGPITRAPRFNPVGTAPPSDAELPAGDPRWSAPFGAAWLLGSVAALTLPGVASLSYGTAEDLETPAGRLLTELAGLAGENVLAAEGAAGGWGGVVAYPVRTADGVRCFAANLSPWPVAAEVHAPAGHGAGGTPGVLELGPWETAELAFPDRHEPGAHHHIPSPLLKGLP